MKTEMNRKTFLHATMATTLTGLVGCSGGDDEGSGGDGDGDMSATAGDGDMSATGGDGDMSATGDGDMTATGDGDMTATGDGDMAAGDGDMTASGGSDAGTGGTDAGSGGTDGSGGQSQMMCGGAVSVMSSGAHQHPFELTAQQVDDAVPGPYPSGGSHSHDIDLSADDFATIKAGGHVRKVTCGGGDHVFIITCDPGSAPAPDPHGGDGWSGDSWHSECPAP